MHSLSLFRSQGENYTRGVPNQFCKYYITEDLVISNFYSTCKMLSFKVFFDTSPEVIIEVYVHFDIQDLLSCADGFRKTV
jgi:hypothetical protein